MHVVILVRGCGETGTSGLANSAALLGTSLPTKGTASTLRALAMFSGMLGMSRARSRPKRTRFTCEREQEHVVILVRNQGLSLLD